MSSEENKELVRRFAQVWSRGGQPIVDELAAPDLVVFYPSLRQPLHGPDAFKQFLDAFYAAFPDAQCTIQELIAEGDRVATRWTLRGTHQGELLGIPATGSAVAWTGMTIIHIRDGKIMEERGESDALGLFQQLGIISTLERAESA
jgi:steroid delta-isomerase-like uncharacterized protein